MFTALLLPSAHQMVLKFKIFSTTAVSLTTKLILAEIPLLCEENNDQALKFNITSSILGNSKKQKQLLLDVNQVCCLVSKT